MKSFVTLLDFGSFISCNTLKAVEARLAEDAREILLAMATGTGKTKTYIALVYRLLKTKRFRRVLFLVDRTALGEQATNVFKETRMENLQTFADIFGIKELGDATSDRDTKVQIDTVQAFVKRILYPNDNTPIPTASATIVDQLLAKLQRQQRKLGDSNRDNIEAAAGMPIPEMINHLRQSNPQQVQEWFRQRAAIAQLLDTRDGGRQPLLISRHADELRRVERGYGNAQRPEDYLDSFGAYLRENINKIPALIVVTTRPRELTRSQLKELRLMLDLAGYSEKTLQVAWREMTNADIAASIIGFIRQATLGDALVPYEERVDKAMKKILASQNWTSPQRQWLERIGKQLKVETIVDREALDQGEFKSQGGFVRLNKAFNGRLEEILVHINEALWQDVG